MSLKNTIAKIDQALQQADEIVEQRLAETKERDAQTMAHQIAAYVLSRAQVGEDPVSLGESMVQGAVIGESEVGAHGGYLAGPVIAFLEGLLEGARGALEGESTDLDDAAHEAADTKIENAYVAESADPVQQALQFFETHDKWPESATPSVLARAKARRLAEQRQ